MSAATAAGGTPDGVVEVTSLAGADCSFAQPRGWPTEIVVVSQVGNQAAEVPTRKHMRGSLLVFTFATEAGLSYVVKPPSI